MIDISFRFLSAARSLFRRPFMVADESGFVQGFFVCFSGESVRFFAKRKSAQLNLCFL